MDLKIMPDANLGNVGLSAVIVTLDGSWRYALPHFRTTRYTQCAFSYRRPSILLEQAFVLFTVLLPLTLSCIHLQNALITTPCLDQLDSNRCSDNIPYIKCTKINIKMWDALTDDYVRRISSSCILFRTFHQY